MYVMNTNKALCDEMVIYLQSMMKFNTQTCDKGRFIIARDIVQVNIDSESPLSLNLPYLLRKRLLKEMKIYEEKFLAKIEFTFPSEFFDDVTFEVNKLIIDNHWTKFKTARQNM